MSSKDTLIGTIASKRWPNVVAEIYRDHTHSGTIFRTKIGSKEYPELITQKHFETKEGAILHAQVVLGF